MGTIDGQDRAVLWKCICDKGTLKQKERKKERERGRKKERERKKGRQAYNRWKRCLVCRRKVCLMRRGSLSKLSKLIATFLLKFQCKAKQTKRRTRLTASGSLGPHS